MDERATTSFLESNKLHVWKMTESGLEANEKKSNDSPKTSHSKNFLKYCTWKGKYGSDTSTNRYK